MADADLAALTEAIARYQQTTHPRWAQVAEWASARLEAKTPRPIVGASGKAVDTAGWLAAEAKGDPLDVPRLFAGFVRGVKSGTGAERVKLLARRRDPRVVSGVLQLLESPPWRAGTALPFFRACLDVLVESSDVRARDGLESLARRYKGIIETSIGEVIAGHCARAAKKLEGVTVAELSAADQARLAELEGVFDAELRAANAKRRDDTRARQSDDDLLSAIYASPDDDGPRLVFADLLTERGDERGEFISLQVHRAAGRGSIEGLEREQALLSDPKRRARWELPLSNAGACTPWRGFPGDVALSPRGLKDLVGLPAWRTVEAVTLPNGASGKTLRALMEHEALRRVRVVRNLGPQNRAMLGDAPKAWRVVDLRYDHDESFGAEVAERYPSLVGLSLWTSGPIDVSALARLTQLEALRLAVNQQLADFEWLPTLARLERLDLQSQLRDGVLPSVLARLPRLGHLTFGWAPTAARVAGLSVDTLSLGSASTQQVGAVSAVLGRVRRLELQTSAQGPLLSACLPTWTASTLQEVQVGRSLRLERTPTGWSAHADFGRVQHAALLDLAATPHVEALVVAPHHASPLHVAQRPTEEELAPFRAAWGARLTCLEHHPRVLAASLQRAWFH